MNHTFSEYKIIALILLTMILNSCKNEGIKNNEKDFDFPDTVSKGIISSDSIKYSKEDLEKIISEYSKKNKALMDFSKYDKSNTTEGVLHLKNNRIIIPLFKNQIYLLNKDALTDTVLTYFGSKSNAFVFSVSEGMGKIKKLNPQINAVILFKPFDISVTQKLYLMKKHTEFQHKERKVTEFYLSGKITDVLDIDCEEKDLKEIFNIE